ncbi:hypothetical protein [Clostridium novyi]|uniref:Uncharacterized protein n=1 Tax=Clostridium novyi (strain NT) TaxID=386415 RepID=A0Q0V6_CLONN|nr:hypothetical protein [Clostridium novyi]ABK61935.1 hypothetical protein NT01CX_2185 [Clostridium novyi NT]KEH88629.1 hypothetical protein Z966_00435 [Clostridium novyi A str. NCTC 538]
MNKYIAEGQISIFDIQVTKAAKKITEKPKNVMETHEKVTESIDLSTVLEKYKYMDNLSRIIKYCGGSYGIELIAPGGFKTIYVNKQGIEEFKFDKRINVLPMDQVLYYKHELKINELQEDRLKTIKEKYRDLREIRRKGDENIIVELEDKVISINPLGWILEFNNVRAIYSQNEVIQEQNKESEAIDIKQMQKSVKVGDRVQAYRSKSEIITGVITREYGLANEILNISFKRGEVGVATAIGRRQIIKILEVGA